MKKLKQERASSHNPGKPSGIELALGVYAQNVTNKCKTKANFPCPRLCRQPERVGPLAKRQSQSQFPVMSFDDVITLRGRVFLASSRLCAHCCLRGAIQASLF